MDDRQLDCAYQSSTALSQTIQCYPKLPPVARELARDLGEFVEALNLLKGRVAPTTEIDLSLLNIPLGTWGLACETFRQTVVEDGRSDAHQRAPRWTRLEFMGGSIDNFRHLLAGFTRCIQSICAVTDLGQSPVTHECLERAKKYIEDATTDLQSNLDLIDEKVQSEVESAHRLTQSIKSSSQQCLQICKQSSHHLDQIQPTSEDSGGSRETGKKTMTTSAGFAEHAKVSDERVSSMIDNHAAGSAVQVLVSTDGNILQGENRALGKRAWQFGGHMSDELVQDISRSLVSVDLGNDTPFDSTKRPEKETEARFKKRFGPGRKLN